MNYSFTCPPAHVHFGRKPSLTNASLANASYPTAESIAAIMAPPGEAADYYNGDEGGQKNYPMQQPQQQQQYYNNGPQQQQQQDVMPPPPTYGQQNNSSYSPDQKTTFEQAFKIEKPKFNDLWAAILFLAVFAGFVAVSGISIQGYSAEKGFNGGGVYGSRNDFGLNTNTIVLFAFVLVVALALSSIYLTLARSRSRLEMGYMGYG